MIYSLIMDNAFMCLTDKILHLNRICLAGLKVATRTSEHDFRFLF